MPLFFEERNHKTVEIKLGIEANVDGMVPFLQGYIFYRCSRPRDAGIVDQYIKSIRKDFIHHLFHLLGIPDITGKGLNSLRQTGESLLIDVTGENLCTGLVKG